jgi:hypothetical protein
MSLIHSLRRTRTQTTAAASETDTLREILQELAQLREERREEREQLQAEMRQRDATFQKMEQQLNQLSRSSSSFILASGDQNENLLPQEELCSSENASVVNLGYKLKSDTFDGSGSLREFFSQFVLIANANNWSEKAKIVALAFCLRRKTRSLLDCVPEIENLSFEELKSKLKLRFGEGHLSRAYYTQFINRCQKFRENLLDLGADIDCQD